MTDAMQDALTASVIAAVRRTPDPRLATILDALVRHLHAFVRETRPTLDEWRGGVAFLTEMGQVTDANHHDVVLASDTLGVSTLVDLINAPGDATTLPALLGPFWKADSPVTPNGGSIAEPGTDGIRVLMSGAVRDDHGTAIAGATIDLWQTDSLGFYDNQYDDGRKNLRGRVQSDADGRYAVHTIKPVPYPIPTHGPAGRLVMAQGRSIYRPGHIHAMVSAPGFRTLITQIFSKGDPYLGRDVTFSAVGGLIAGYEPAAPDTGVDETLHFDFILAEGASRTPDAPIG